VAYYQADRISEFLEIMNFVMHHEMEKACFSNATLKKAQFHNTLASYYLYMAASETESEKRIEYFNHAIQNANKSGRISLEESRLFGLKGFVKKKIPIFARV
jgi:hypothetical protein